MSVKTDDLGSVYGARSVEEIHAAYEGWAATYDAENLAKGFRLPGVAAGFVARYVSTSAGTILDAGCGTGLVGEALGVLGYPAVDGIDLSEEMLGLAQARGCYQGLAVQELGKPIPVEDGAYAAFACIGSFGPGHAPPESLDELVRVTRAGGFGVFNLVEATWEEQGFGDKIAELERAGLWRVVERPAPFRPYLLGEPELLSRVFVCEML